MHQPKNFTFFLFILLSIPSFAQLSIGLKGGYSRVWQHYGDTEVPENAVVHLNRFNTSIFAYKKMNKYLSLGIEPGYIQRGAACVPGTIFFTDDRSFYLDYISLPIFISGQIGLFDNKVSLFLKTGYSISRFVYGEIEEFNVAVGEVVRYRIQTGVNLREWDHGVHIGGGVDIPIKKGEIRIEYEYYTGFQDAIGGFDSQNRNLNMNIGYSFQL